MVYVVFENLDPRGPRECSVGGPYFSAAISGGKLYAGPTRGHEPFVLAFLEGDPWRVHDGLGEEGPSYESVIFRSTRPSAGR
jgi:hypothetical protein